MTRAQRALKVPQQRTVASECLEVVSASLATRDHLPLELRVPHERVHLGLRAGWGSTTGDRPYYQAQASPRPGMLDRPSSARHSMVYW